jgi:GMP synthase (glutamine-hydrolysing)
MTRGFIDTQVQEIRTAVGDSRVLLALSGGVDSSVCAALLAEAIGAQLVCIFVDHGFMRLHEPNEVEAAFANRGWQFIRVHAADRFLEKVRGITDPEQKRKIIGEEFIRVFEDEAAKLGHIPFFAQGTIYPDIAESGDDKNPLVKSHHNVGGMPANLNFDKVIEPLSTLYKPDVRLLGRQLGLPAALTERQPFPGPGLAVRVLGEITREKLDTLRQADAIWREEIEKLPTRPSQYFAVMTDSRAVGVKGDTRTFDHVVALRAITTTDYMTATPAEIPYSTLQQAAHRIAQTPGISRIVYDISPKPPGTIEWL